MNAEEKDKSVLPIYMLETMNSKQKQTMYF